MIHSSQWFPWWLAHSERCSVNLCVSLLTSLSDPNSEAAATRLGTLKNQLDDKDRDQVTDICVSLEKAAQC